MTDNEIYEIVIRALFTESVMPSVDYNLIVKATTLEEAIKKANSRMAKRLSNTKRETNFYTVSANPSIFFEVVE